MSQVAAPFTFPPSQLPKVPPRQRVRKFSVSEYHDLIERGYFAGDEQYELLEGWIIGKMSRNPPHDAAIDKAREAIQDRLPKGWRVRVQSAVTLADSEPEPDLAVVPGPADRYSGPIRRRVISRWWLNRRRPRWTLTAPIKDASMRPPECRST